MSTKNFLRIGVFYDGTFFIKAQNYFWGQKYGWLSFQEFHKLLESSIFGQKNKDILHTK